MAVSPTARLAGRPVGQLHPGRVERQEACLDRLGFVRRLELRSRTHSGKGSVLAAKAVGTHKARAVPWPRRPWERTRQGQCLDREGRGNAQGGVLPAPTASPAPMPSSRALRACTVGETVI